MKTFIVSAIIVIGVIWGIGDLIVHGIHFNTGEGEHTGYVTAVETKGVFYKTTTAYVKTNTQSSQEDAYCVIDPQVIAQLKTASVSKASVTVHYFDWFAKGVADCDGESDIISGVSVDSGN